jgi:hypothetical protein
VAAQEDTAGFTLSLGDKSLTAPMAPKSHKARKRYQPRQSKTGLLVLRQYTRSEAKETNHKEGS